MCVTSLCLAFAFILGNSTFLVIADEMMGNQPSGMFFNTQGIEIMGQGNPASSLHRAISDGCHGILDARSSSPQCWDHQDEFQLQRHWCSGIGSRSIDTALSRHRRLDHG